MLFCAKVGSEKSRFAIDVSTFRIVHSSREIWNVGGNAFVDYKPLVSNGFLCIQTRLKDLNHNRHICQQFSEFMILFCRKLSKSVRNLRQRILTSIVKMSTWYGKVCLKCSVPTCIHVMHTSAHPLSVVHILYTCTSASFANMFAYQLHYIWIN